MSRFAKTSHEYTCTICRIILMCSGQLLRRQRNEMGDSFKPAVKQLPIETRPRLDEAGVCSTVPVDARIDEYADEFNLNDIGLAMVLSTYRALG